MPTYTTIPEYTASEQVTDVFGGYNHNLKINDGEFYDMRNLTSDYYPLMGNRQLRSMIAFDFEEILGMAVDGDGDLYVVGSRNEDTGKVKLFKIYKGEDNAYGKIVCVTDNSYSQIERDKLKLSRSKKQMMFFGNRLVIFPDAVYVELNDFLIDTEQYTEWYKLGYERAINLSEKAFLMIKPCDAEGNEMSGTASATAPASPTEGSIWIDTSDGKIVWKKYSATTWITLTDVYVELSIATTMSDYWDIRAGDAVTVGGVGELNGSHIVIKAYSLEGSADVKRFVINGIVSEKKKITSGTFTMKREIPQMDFVVQAQNRLWGCRYHDAESLQDKSINEIYACKLGDARNWNVFQGLSTDSYTASCGTMGKFTGAANVNGYPVFFKENCYHKVHISSSGAHQITDKAVQGVQDDCSGSVTMIDDICYYKSRAGVMAFDGSQAYSISNELGDVLYTEADGGGANGKYYISLKDASGDWTLFAYDVQRRLWHKEDNEHAMIFAGANNGAFYTTEHLGSRFIYVISNYLRTGTQEQATGWEAVTGLLGYSYTGQKYVSRFNLRMMLPEGSGMDIYIEYDSSGKWEHQGHIKGTGTTTFMLPVKPRRCDHFRIKLSGVGTVRLYSMSKLFEGGTDIR